MRTFVSRDTRQKQKKKKKKDKKAESRNPSYSGLLEPWVGYIVWQNLRHHLDGRLLVTSPGYIPGALDWPKLLLTSSLEEMLNSVIKRNVCLYV